MGLTLGEKSHWRDRIAKRIDQRIETLMAKQDPTLLQRVAEQAREKAYESPGSRPASELLTCESGLSAVSIRRGSSL